MPPSNRRGRPFWPYSNKDIGFPLKSAWLNRGKVKFKNKTIKRCLLSIPCGAVGIYHSETARYWKKANGWTLSEVATFQHHCLMRGKVRLKARLYLDLYKESHAANSHFSSTTLKKSWAGDKWWQEIVYTAKRKVTSHFQFPQNQAN